MAIYCRNCGKGRGYPTSSVRTGGNAPCQFCGEVDSRPARNARTGQVEQVALGNYSYPDNLLPDNPNEINRVRERESQQGKVQN